MIKILISGSVAQLYILNDKSCVWGDEHVHDTAYVEWIVRGGYTRCVDGGQLQLATGSAYLTGPDIAHSDHYKEDYESICFEYIRSEENKLLRQRGIRTLTLKQVSCRMIEQCDVAAEIAAPDDLSPLWLDALVSDVLLQTIRVDRSEKLSGVDPSATPPRWVRGVYDRLHEEAGLSASLDDLARQAGVHPAHLSRVFTRVYGVPIAQFQRQQRLKRAAQNLLSSRSIVDVASDAGYQAQSQFTTAFRKAFGVSPGRYRLQHRA